MTEQQNVWAFAPGNISCFFKLQDNPDPRLRGSLGLGFTVNEGVTVSVEKSKKTNIYFNEKLIAFPTVFFVIDHLTQIPVSVRITSILPLGAGFGLSGASAIATAYAVNKLLNLGKTEKELAIIAHTADAAQRTGLGDVVNQYVGGMMVKFYSSAEFLVQKIALSGVPVYWTYFSPISTKSILTDEDFMIRINKAADVALFRTKQLFLIKNIRFTDLITISKEYALLSGLLQDAKTKQTIIEIEKHNGHASMIVLGNAVFSDIPFKNAKKLFISEKNAQIL